MERERYVPKHCAEEDLRAHQRFMRWALTAILEVSTLELFVATMHFLLTAAVVFGIIHGKTPD